MNDKTGRTLRIIAIIFMGLTAAMNILGGIGTVCAAFLTKQFPPMWALLEYQWLYQSLMITTIIVGIAGVWATIVLIRGRHCLPECPYRTGDRQCSRSNSILCVDDAARQRHTSKYEIFYQRPHPLVLSAA
jgi:hypothetical protein